MGDSAVGHVFRVPCELRVVLLRAASPLRGYASCVCYRHVLGHSKFARHVCKAARSWADRVINIILMDYLGVDQLGSGSRARITYVAHVTLAIRAETVVGGGSGT